ncbi:MAG: hypothetical protein ABI675_02715 [Chitinophagaceae bacterium]
MKLYLISILFLISFTCQAQDEKPLMPVVKTMNVDFDNTRKDLSLLDRLWLTAKVINPNSHIIPNKDSLFITFDLPPWIKLPDSLFLYYCQTYYEALSISFVKDSMKYKAIGIQVCNDSLHCGIAWYDMSTHDYKKQASFSEKATRFLQANFFQNVVMTSEPFNDKSAMILRYYIDTSFNYTQPNFIYSYFHCVSIILADLIYKSPSKIRRKYDELIVLFCCQGRLQYFWRIPINKDQLSKFYTLKYYESTLK